MGDLVIDRPKCKWLRVTKRKRDAMWFCNECRARRIATKQPECACEEIRIPARRDAKE